MPILGDSLPMEWFNLLVDGILGCILCVLNKVTCSSAWQGADSPGTGPHFMISYKLNF